MTEVLERYLTRSEEKRLFAAVAARADVWARRDHAWMLLMRHTGGRVGSIAGLTVNDAQKALREKQLLFVDAHAKRGIGYSTYVNAQARDALKRLLKIRRELRASLDPDAPLIVSRNHRAMSVRSFQARLKYWADVAGLAVAVTPHWFRHTLGRRLVETSESKDPLAIVQRALGHTTRKNTPIYMRPSREDVETAMEMQV